jgi:hypothetical protein
MLYRMMTDRLPFEANNDLESLLRVQKAEFVAPQQAKPTVGDAVAAIIGKAMRLAPGERYQTADEMLIEVERVLRNDFHSAGQTELKAWLEQLGRRDNAPPIGKAPRDAGGVVRDAMGTDLSAGTSFELRDLDQSGAETEVQRTPPPGGRSDGRGTDGRRDAAPPHSGHTAEIVKPGATAAGRRRGNGFWLGVFLTVAAMIGARYLLAWAQNRGVMSALGLGGSGGAERHAPPPAVGPTWAPPSSPSSVPAPAAPAVEPAPGAPPAVAAKPPVADAGIAPPPAAEGRPSDQAASDEKTPAAEKNAPDENAKAEKPTAEKTPADKAPPAERADDDDTDEEALLRTAVPNAESAVIGEDDAEAETPAKPATRPRGAAKAAPELPRVETAILHITSAPAGAVVKTKARVLGRTPINLHFKTGNTYEIILVKRGYQPATRRVAVHSTKDRKVAVTLKKSPVKRTFFHPHR